MKLFNRKSDTSQTKFQLVTERGNGVYAWSGQIFESDTIKSCVRPTAVAMGKTTPKHVRNYSGTIQVNPEPYMKFLLEEPNPYMSCQQFLEKMTRQRELNGNAFAFISRDTSGIPIGLYPIDATSVQAEYDKSNNLYLKFQLINGEQYTFSYSDIIHLRRDFCNNDVFGTSPVSTLIPLLNIIGTVDKSIVQAVKNGGLVRWLLKFQTSMRDEDLEKSAKKFSDNYLSMSSNGMGVAATDSKADAIQVKTDDYVPNAQIIDRTSARFYNHFGTNQKIIQSSYDENEWNAFYESSVEPVMIDFSEEMTRKLFTRKERGFGNKIIFESSNLQYASMSTKLALAQMVDRGAMTPNEWREAFNKAPVKGGDEPIRRLDTQVVSGATTSAEGGEE